MPYKDPKRRRENDRERYRKKRELLIAQATARYEKIKSDPAKYAEHRDKHRAYNKKFRTANPLKSKAHSWHSQDKVKRQVFSHYSNGAMRCAMCGEEDFVVLALDHINDDGAEDRKRSGSGGNGGGTHLYSRLRKQGFPPGFQVLCHNCNWKKQHLRHVKKRCENPYYDPYYAERALDQ